MLNLDINNTYMGRLDQMQAQINPTESLPMILSKVQANLELLYIKAKNYHWNVTGVGFQGVHEMFDQIQEYAVNQADRVAERMRYHDVLVQATARDFINSAWFSEGTNILNQNGMLNDMCMTLSCMINHLDEYISQTGDTPVDQNMLQDISEGLGKFCYFVRSNMSVEEKTLAY